MVQANAAEDLLTILPVVMEESHSVRNTDEISSSNDSCDDDDDCQRLEPDMPELFFFFIFLLGFLRK